MFCIGWGLCISDAYVCTSVGCARVHSLIYEIDSFFVHNVGHCCQISYNGTWIYTDYSIPVRTLTYSIFPSLPPQQDVRIVVEKYKSGFALPLAHEFEDLGDPGNPNSQAPPAHNTPKSVARSETMKGTQSGGKAKQRKGLFGIFSSSKVRKK